MYNRGGVKPDGVETLQPPGPDAERVWLGDHSLPAEQQGVVVLGAPLGTQRFAEEHGKEKLEKELDLLDLVAQVPDLQCAWVTTAVLRSACQLHPANTTSRASSGVRSDTRLSGVGNSLQTPGARRLGTAPPARQQTRLAGTTSDATGRMWAEVCVAHSTSSMVGVLGGHSAHDTC